MMRNGMKSVLLGVFLLLPVLTYSSDVAVAYRMAAFIPEERVIRRVYDTAFVDYQLEGTYCLQNNWALWANISYTEKSGKSLGVNNHTRMRQLPLTFGIKKSFCLHSDLTPYLGAGIGATFLRLHDQSPYVRQHINQTGFAVLLKSGLEYCLTQSVYADAFVDYNWNFFDCFHSKKNIKTYNIQTGGVKIGLGIGCRF